MKRILIIVGLAFGCSSVYAQVINQTGDNNILDVVRTGVTNPATNYSVNQFKGYNEIHIKQGPDQNSPGKENTITLRQVSIGVTAVSLRNVFNVSQDGASNSINGDQYGMNNRATLNQTPETTSSNITTSQSGRNNGIVVNQTNGSGYTANIRQGAVIPAGFLNPPDGTSGPLPNTRFNSATLTQSGFQGSATVIQAGVSGLFIGKQAGGDLVQNVLFVTQNNNAGADVEQSGNNNTTTIVQNGYQYARVRQNSLDPAVDTEPVNGIIEIRQGVNTLDDTRNTAFVEQRTGDGNITRVFQNTTEAEKNMATVKQFGTRLGGTPSTVVINQQGKSSTITVEQMKNGSGNDAAFTQSGSELAKGSNAALMQGGNNNDFTTNQIGKQNNIGGTVGAGASASSALQTGTNNIVNVGQQGQMNQAAIKQEGSGGNINVQQINDLASGPIGNKATAIQSAQTSANIIQIFQIAPDGDENEAIVEQTAGDGNFTRIDQYESDYAKVTQSGTDDLGNTSTVNINQQNAANSKATVTQAAGTKGGDVTITQTAVRNEATVDQTAGRQNNTTVTQNNDDNKAKVTQSGTLEGAVFSSVIVNQQGKMGEATVTQSANASTAQVFQYGGDRNKSTITQAGRLNTAVAEQAGNDNEATQGQTGDNNVIRTLQSSATPGVFLATGEQAKNTTSVTQGGSNNDAVTAQKGFTNDAVVNQSAGRDNFAASIQFGTKNSVTTNQTTVGKNNTAVVRQFNTTNVLNGGDLSSRDANTSRNNIVAAGPNYNNNPANGIGQVENNKATITQSSGENQMVDVFQSGDDETATITQAGTDNMTTLTQPGEFDKATITQNGSLGVAAVSQDGTDGQAGNVLTATQAGDNNAFALGQAGYNNSVLIDQKGSENGVVGGQVFGGIFAGQKGQRNTMDIKQDAQRSTVNVAQGSPLALPPIAPPVVATDLTNYVSVFDNKLTVDQKGRQNIMGIAQEGDNGQATATQAGENNTLNIVQANINGVPSIISLPNIATATQAALVSNSTIDIRQVGRGNVGTATQNAGRFNVIALDQNLDQNTATLTQNGGNSNLIAVVQSTAVGFPKGNTATVTQGVGQRNVFRLNQPGYNNTLTGTQTGDDNKVQDVNANANSFAEQSGHDNTATLSQTGELHTINFLQSGQFNMSTITQSNF